MKYKVGNKVGFKGTDITGTIEKIKSGTCIVQTSTSKVTAFPEDLILIEELAKEVACECHKNQEFVSLVKRMREAQKLCDTMASKIEDETKRAELLWEIMNDSINLESEVDEYLMKIND